MIKRYKKILFGLIAAAIIAVLAYFGVLLVQNNQAKRAAEEEAKKIVFRFDAEKISTMDIKNSTGEYSFKLGYDGWEFTAGEEFKFSPDRFVEIAQTMSSLTASKIIKEEAADLTPYGLDNPMVIKYTLAGGSEYTSFIGSKVPGESAYYFMSGDSDTVYTISGEAADAMNVELENIKETLMFDAASASDVTYLKYTDHGKLVYDIEKTGEREWKMNGPYKNGVVNTSEVTGICSMIIRAEASTFIDASAGNLSEYGFDNPSFEIELKSAGDEAKLVFGNYYDENERFIYAYNEELGQVYVFEAGELGFIGTNTESVLYRRLRTEAFADIKKFEMNIFGTVIDIDYNYIVELGKECSYSVNGKDIDITDDAVMETFNNLINATTGLAYDYVSYDKFNPADKEPAAKVVYKMREGDDYVLELYEKEDDPSLLYVCENGKFNEATIRKSVVENGVLLYYKDLMDIIK